MNFRNSNLKNLWYAFQNINNFKFKLEIVFHTKTDVSPLVCAVFNVLTNMYVLLPVSDNCPTKPKDWTFNP